MKRLSLILILAAIILSTMVVSVSAQSNNRAVATHIVIFRAGADVRATASALATTHGLQVTNLYRYALNGMAAVVPAGRLRALQNDPRVATVEENMVVSIQVQSVPTGIDRSYTTSNPLIDIDGTDDLRVDVDVAVLDTGIDRQHPDLNVVGGIDCTLRSGGFNFYCGAGNGGDDDQYHGTHVAGTIAALDNGIGVVGIAPGARLWAVKVLNSQGSGYTSGIIAGIDWVIAQGTIEVINMSLGGSGISTAYQTAIDNAVANGVVVVVAAGNSSADASNYSPAFVPSAITVSALADFNGLPGGGAASTCRTDVDDSFADFSNYGNPIDVIAPGVCILSTYPIEQGEYASISGTSMASPHVAGAAALLASVNNPNNAADVANIRNQIVNSGTMDWNNADDRDSTKEPLLYTRNFGATLIPYVVRTVRVDDLDAVRTLNRKGSLSMSVTITVRNQDGALASGAVVTGTFSVGGSKSCTTGTNGTCTVTSGGSTTASSISYSVTGISLSGHTYLSSANTDVDGGSDGTTISVNR